MQRRIINWVLIEAALTLGVFSVQQTAAHAETVTGVVSVAGLIDSHDPNTNYGNQELDLYLNDNAVNSSDLSATAPSRGLISLKNSSGNSIVSVPTGAVITSVTLNLRCAENWQISGTKLTQSPRAMVYALTTGFTEYGATWRTSNGSNAWNTVGGDYDSSVYAESGAASDGLWTTIDLTSIWSNADVQNNGLLLTFDPESTSIFENDPSDGAFCKLFFAGSNAGSSAPYITVTYSTVPEPASIAMLGVGALGFLAYRRRKSKKAARRS